jgi:hypothetical protein
LGSERYRLRFLNSGFGRRWPGHGS